MGLEPTTICMASRCSTTELLPPIPKQSAPCTCIAMIRDWRLDVKTTCGIQASCSAFHVKHVAACNQSSFLESASLWLPVPGTSQQDKLPRSLNPSLSNQHHMRRHRMSCQLPRPE